MSWWVVWLTFNNCLEGCCRLPVPGSDPVPLAKEGDGRLSLVGTVGFVRACLCRGYLFEWEPELLMDGL